MRRQAIACTLLLTSVLICHGQAQVPLPLSPVPGGGTPYTASSAMQMPTAPVAPAASSMGSDRGQPTPVAAKPQVWVAGDYLYWTMNGPRLPPLLTASPPGTPIESAGVLGTPGTTIVFGGQEVLDDFRSGFRVRSGIWLDDQQSCGIEIGFFWLDGNRTGATAGSLDGSQIVSRPFLDALSGLPNAELVSFPGVLAGTSTVDASTSNLWGADASWRHQLCCGCLGKACCECTRGYHLDLIAGVRYFSLNDSVTITENLTALENSLQPGTRFLISDEFLARNWFLGGSLGLDSELIWDRWSLWSRVRVSLGNTRREVSIRGQTITTEPNEVPTVGTGGLLALPSNIGDYKSNRFTILPEADFQLGYAICDYCRLVFGYSILYWPGVARAGEQIDLVVNPNQLPPADPGPLVGPARPRFSFQSRHLFVHGFSTGLILAF